MAEGARPKVCIRQRIGFESPHRHIQGKSSYESTGFFFYSLRKGMRIPDRVRQLATASWTDCERSEQIARTKTPGAFLNNACVGPKGRGPWMGRVTASEASQSPHRHIQGKSSYESTGFFFIVSEKGMRTLSPCAFMSVALRLPDLQKLLFNHPCILFCKKIHQRPDGRQ